VHPGGSMAGLAIFDQKSVTLDSGIFEFSFKNRPLKLEFRGLETLTDKS